MLNRRILRTKVMSAFFGLEFVKSSEYEIALESIASAYKPNLNSMEPQDLTKLEGLRKLTQLEFDEMVGAITETDQDTEVPIEVRKLALSVFKNYQSNINSAEAGLLKNILKNLDLIYKHYLMAIDAVNQLALLAQSDQDGRLLKDDLVDYSRLNTNQLVVALRNTEEINVAIIKHNAQWDTDSLLTIRQFYQDILRHNEQFRAYCQQKSSTFEEDANLIMFLVRDQIFNGVLIKDHFERKDLFWSENSSIVRSLTLKTIRVNTPDQISLQAIARQWDEDKEFLSLLVKETVAEYNALDKEIYPKITNWESDRVATIDMILMKLAITEMVHFRSIPVKASINEYMEIAKNYSTPQSGKFINGVLDQLATEYLASGKIRKTGRGLIDNK
jgi:transcription antitermination protein NusB